MRGGAKKKLTALLPELPVLTGNGVYTPLQSIHMQLSKYKRLLTPAELADMLAISVKTIYARVKAGTIPAVHLGASIRFDPAVIAYWLQQRAA